MTLLLIALARGAAAQTISLDPASLQIHHVTAERATWKGRAAIRVTDAGAQNLSDGARLAIVPGVEFQDGIVEADVAGDTKPDLPPVFRGFTGLAFRVSGDGARYEAFYLRPKNGRSEDQEQRNHSAQYISNPEFPWQRLRAETPGRYETYMDLVPGEWTNMKIEVHGAKARLFVHGVEQPALLVNDLKHGVSKGGIALWIGPGTIAYFANLRVTRQ